MYHVFLTFIFLLKNPNIKGLTVCLVFCYLFNFCHFQISKNSQSKTLPLSNLFQAKFHFNFGFNHSWLSFLAQCQLSLKFLYLFHCDILITKECNWQAGEKKCFDCEEICACALQSKTLKMVEIEENAFLHLGRGVYNWLIINLSLKKVLVFSF